MGVGAGLYMCDVVKKFTFAISSPDEFLSYMLNNLACFNIDVYLPLFCHVTNLSKSLWSVLQSVSSLSSWNTLVSSVRSNTTINTYLLTITGTCRCESTQLQRYWLFLREWHRATGSNRRRPAQKRPACFVYMVARCLGLQLWRKMLNFYGAENSTP